MRAPLAAVLLVALLLSPVALAKISEPPAGAAVQTGLKASLATWVGNGTNASNADIHPGDSVVAWFGVQLPPSNTTNASRFALVNVSGTVPTFAPVQLNLTLSTNGSAWAFGNVTMPTSTTANGTQPAFYYNATVFEVANGTTSVLDTFGGSGPNIVVSTTTAPAPFLSTPILVGGGIVLLLAVAIGAYGVRQRNVRRRMRGRTRSSTLQQLEQEERAKKPEQIQQVQQEIRQQEEVRTRRRELQILDAKRADAQKGLDLLKKRHEMGALSKLQYDTMSAKRQAELERIEAEIAQMEAES